MKRKILSLALCAALFSTALCTGVQAAGMGEFQKQQTYSGQFHDINGKWYETYIADLYEYGLAQGTSKNTMSPDEPVTVAQIVALAARVCAKYYDGKIAQSSGKWFEPYISFAIDYGLITMEDAQDIDRPATRGESALILSRCLPDRHFDAVNAPVVFEDIAEDNPCSAAVNMLSRAGVIAGYEDGLFRPDQGISRAEAMTIIDRMVNKTLRRGYNEWLQNRPADEGQGTGTSHGSGNSGENQGSDPIGVGVGFGRATFLLKGIAMITVDMENSNFILAVYADQETGGMVTMTGVCEVKSDTNGNIIASCVVTDRVSQGGASAEIAAQAAALDMLGFTYDGDRSLRLTEAIVNRQFVSGKQRVVGMLSVGETFSVVN